MLFTEVVRPIAFFLLFECRLIVYNVSGDKPNNNPIVMNHNTTAMNHNATVMPYNTTTALTTTLSTTMEEVPEINIDDLSMEEICAIIEIPEENCTCKHLPEICNIEEIEIFEFSCTKSTDFSLGVVKLSAAFLGAAGNILVVIVTFYNQSHIGQYRKLVGYLALCEFIFAIFQILISIPLLWTCKWIYSAILCKILSASSTFGGLMPLAIIVIIATERYFGIIKPFEKQKFLSKIWILIIVCLIACGISTIPLFITLGVNGHGLCVSNWRILDFGETAYNWFLLIATFVLPITAISIMYYKVVRFLYTQVSSCNGVLNLNEKQRLSRLQLNKRVLKILVAVLVAYFVLVLPNRLGWLILNNMKNETTADSYHVLKFFILVPYQFHIMINPLIYSVIDSKFRQDFISIYKPRRSTYDYNMSNSVLTIEQQL